MKLQILNVLLLYVICVTNNAQNIERNVISTAGGSALVNGQYFDWTIGESVIETINNEEFIFSEGFHQPTGTIPFMYRIDGLVLGDGIPYSDAEVFLYIADAGTSIPALIKTDAPGGSFSFSFIPEDNYLIYAVPDVSDEYYPTYYVKTIDRNKAYVLQADANVGGLDLQLVSKLNFSDELEQENDFDFSIFPNPFIDHLSIFFNTNYQKTFKIKIIDLTGKILLSKEISSDDILTLNLVNWPDGLYFVNIEYELGSYNKLISKVRRNSSIR